MSLPTPSKEQLKAIEVIKSGKNLLLDCCAGSGKTTTNMYIAKRCPDKSILILTYNKKLKHETRDKVTNLELNNVEVHSYHSFCVKYYDRTCYTDSVIDLLLKKKKRRLKEFSYDIVIIDEAQDMTPTYFELICKLLSDMKSNPQICILGDRNQSIYKFNSADERFITYAKDIFNFNKKEWDMILLNISYRITNNMSTFLNNCAFRYERMKSIKMGSKIKYIIYNPYNRKIEWSYPYKEVMKLLKIYDYEDIFILAPSVRSQKSPIRKLANILSDKGYPIYVPSENDKELDNEIIKGKIVFSTYHQTKGLERKVVIVYGCDSGYFKYYNKNADPTKCPNEIYVAWTRAQERLVIMHSSSNDYLPFLDRSLITTYADVAIEGKFKDIKDKKISCAYGTTAVTDLTRHVSSRVIDKVMEYIDIEHITESEEIIDIPIKVTQNNLTEGVSDITGTAIPGYCEYLVKDTMTIYEDIKHVLDIKKPELANLDNLTPEKLLKITNYYQSIVSGYVYRINQIKKYDWLSKENLDRCVKRVIDKISKDTKFEMKLSLTVNSRNIVGYIDAVEKDTIYEFKCIKEFSDDHFIQLAIYAYMYEKMMLDDLEEGDPIECNGTNGNIQKIHDTGEIDIKTDTGEIIQVNNLSISGNRYVLYNILSNETWEIKPNMNRLRRMIEYLVDEKYSNKKNTDDDNFIKEVNDIKKKYFD